MKWQNEAIEDLKHYWDMQNSLNNIRERISILEEDYTTIKSNRMDVTPVMGGSSKVENRLINNIVERQRLEDTYQETQKMVQLIKRGLDGLDDKEKLVLERFYIHRSGGHVEQLMEETYAVQGNHSARHGHHLSILQGGKIIWHKQRTAPN